MRHGKKFNHLKRKSAHRKALMRNMASALIEHKRINTTLAKAKALRQYVEPLVTKAKANTTHSRRVVFTYLHNKEAVTELFGPVADAVAERPGGYTRVIRTGFVDFNEVYEGGKSTGTGGGRSRRRRRGGRGGSSTGTETAATQTKKQTPKSDEEE